MAIQVGSPAPNLTGTDQNGQTVHTTDYLGRYLVVFFYPKDGTAVCTKEACLFRDAYEDFLQDGAAVIGVSADSESSHQSFAATQRLPYPLISDRDGTWRTGFGVPKTLWFLPGRVTYLIDPAGQIRNIVQSALDAERHVRETRQVLHALRQEASLSSDEPTGRGAQQEATSS